MLMTQFFGNPLSKPAVVDVNRGETSIKQMPRKNRDLPGLTCVWCHLIQFNVLKAKLRLTNLTQNLQSNKGEYSYRKKKENKIQTFFSQF